MDQRTLADDFSVDKGVTYRKTHNNENRLRLKRSNVESVYTLCDASNTVKYNTKCLLGESSHKTQCQEESIVDNCSIKPENDSILEFKSPESKRATPTKLARSTKNTRAKKKRTVTAKFKLLDKEEKVKKHASNKRNLCESQCSIESSFFKQPKTDIYTDIPATNIKTAFVCPLCFKGYKDSDSQTLHMKMCAVKNNISTKRLLDAIELQKRQANERKSLGLLTAPTIPEKKKSTSQRMSVYEESDLQLALAISKSLQDSKELDEIKETETITRISNLSSFETVTSTHKGPLENFGFANSKAATVHKPRKRKFDEMTVLQTRSQEDRNRILTERIAEILVGTEPITQNFQENTRCNKRIRDKQFPLRSVSLQNLLSPDKELWNKTRLTPNQKHFYVRGLSEHIIPAKENIDEIRKEADSTNESVEINHFAAQETNIDRKYTFETYDEELKSLNGEVTYCKHGKFVDTLTADWGNTLNDSSASDLIIFVSNDKHIWTHKLVFYVRCSNILLDVEPNNNSMFIAIKEKICWTDTSYDTALAFLEFVYCGTIKKYASIMEDPKVLTNLRNFARKYKIKELFDYLQDRKITDKQAQDILGIQYDKLNEISSNCIKCDDMEEDVVSVEMEKSNDKLLQECIGNIFPQSETELDMTFPRNEDDINSSITNIPSQELKDYIHIEESIHQEFVTPTSIHDSQRCSMSPDLFDDTDDLMKHHATEYISPKTDINNSKRINQERELNTSNHKSCLKETDSTGSTELIETIYSDSMQTNRPEKEDFSTIPVGFAKSDSTANSLLATPQCSKTDRTKQTTRSIIKKQKSNLSIFIEQFQKINAKSDFDSDSDYSMLSLSNVKLNRNPFNINQHNDSDQYLAKSCKNVQKNLKKQPTGLDMLEYNRTNPEIDLTQDFNHAIDTEGPSKHLNFETTLDVTPTFEHNLEKSTEKYFGNLSSEILDNKNHSQSSETVPSGLRKFRTESINSENDSLHDADTVIASPASLSDANEDTTVFNDDTDENDISMYTKYKRNHRNNSIETYREMVKKCMLNNSVHYTNPKHEFRKDNDIDNEDVTVLSNNGSDITVHSIEEQNSWTERLLTDLDKSKQSPESGKVRNEIIEENKNHYCSRTNITPTTNNDTLQKRNNGSRLRHTKSDSNIDINKSEKQDTSLTQLNLEMNNFDSADSLVLLSSSPEMNFDDFTTESCGANQFNTSIREQNELDDTDKLFEKEIYLANANIDDDTYNNASHSDITKLTQIDKRSINSSTKVAINDAEKVTSKRRNSTKMQRSISESNFRGNVKDDTNKIRKFNSSYEPNKYHCKCGHRTNLKLQSPPVIIRDNVTPPPDYDNMKTPELHKELQKYGLKVQKRCRAMKLLRYIYNELHPVVSTSEKESECAIISSADEESPWKRMNQNTNNANRDSADHYEYEFPLSQNSSNASTESEMNVIVEESRYDELEPITVTENNLNISDVFLKLIKMNKQLHNKILAYEPLCIESLRCMLKAEGLKCKMNSLMEFLDEQCITFYCQENSIKNRAKKN